jgi:TMEM175 potassium channel family protein
MTAHTLHDHHLMDLDRLTAFIDGVFAVALTLLVLDLKLPSDTGDLPRALREMLPGFLIYLIVFGSVAGYWTIHNLHFRRISHGDARLVVLSLVNLLFVTLYPVSASIVGAHPLEPLATVCLSANSLLYCLSGWAIWSYAAAHRQLLTQEADRWPLQREARIMLLVAASLGLAIPLAYLNVFLVYAVWILCAPIAAWIGIRARGKKQSSRFPGGP